MLRIFSAGRQGVKVCAIQLLSLVISPVALWGGWEAARTYGLHPSEGGELAPLALRLLLGGFLAAIGAGFVVGMWVYGRCYVREAEVDPERGVLRLTLAGFVMPSRLEVPLQDVGGSREHDGRFRAGGMTVNAPWSTVRLRGRRLPLIIDVQGEFIRRELIVQYLLRAHRRRRGTVPSR